MNRRQFLGALSAVGAETLLPFGSNAWAFKNNTLINQNRLIVIMLRGAVDGLSVVVPYADKEYYAARPSISLPPPPLAGGVTDLDGYFGLHPSLSMLMPYWKNGSMGFVHASGSPDETRSHFDAQLYMESGTPGVQRTTDGWMSRLIQALPKGEEPTRAIALGTTLPHILSGAPNTANLPSGDAAKKQSVLDRPTAETAFAQLYAKKNKIGDTYRQAQASHKELKAASMDEEMMQANGNSTLPSGFSADAKYIANIMRHDANVQMAFFALGGWDTHTSQGSSKGQLANRLQQLGQGLAVLIEQLGNLYKYTNIVVMSEFGRTFKQNGTDGTDHGHGNVMWLLGGQINGGKVHGIWPGLMDKDLHEERDLAVTTDFRHVLAQVAVKHMGLNSTQSALVFPKLLPSPSTLALIKTEV